ncbi:MAG: AAA family ATPase [Acidobacteriales bacterium]|nr:AAA family ATPase [Terriglobales bacterium]
MIAAGLIGVSADDASAIDNYLLAQRLGHVVLSFEQFDGDLSYPLAQIARLSPSLLFVHTGCRDLEALFRALRRQLPDAAIAAIGEPADAQAILLSMRAGVREFIPSPIHPDDLSAAIERALQHRQASQSLRYLRHGRVNAVLSARGGSGATTFAVNLALYLQQKDRSTAIVDLAARGHVALHLNLSAKFSAFDALTESQRLDHALLDSFLRTCPQGVHMLGGHAISPATKWERQDLQRLLQLLAAAHQNVVIDLSSRLDDLTRDVCSIADRVFILSETDKVSVWSAHEAVGFLGPDITRKVSVVLNRCGKGGAYAETEIETALGTKVAAAIPSNYPAAKRALDRGVPDLSSGFTRALSTLINL